MAYFCLLLSVLVVSLNALAQAAQKEVQLAPGWGRLGFAAPEVGTYELPKINRAEGGEILTSRGVKRDLSDFLGEKITVLSFIYRTCDDVNGCPLSTMVLNKVARKVSEQPALANNLRLLTLSFDPEFDTPEAMHEFGQGIRGSTKNAQGEADWHFLTSESDEAIKPILKAYQQSVVADPETRKGGRKKFSHILRVYLIDREKQIRNIYNVSFLHPDILINDILTLIAQETAGSNEAKKQVSN